MTTEKSIKVPREMYMRLDAQARVSGLSMNRLLEDIVQVLENLVNANLLSACGRKA